MVFPKPGVRAAVLADAGMIADAHKQCFPEEPWSRESIRSLLDHPMTFGLIVEGAMRRDQAFGFGLLRAIEEECEVLTLGIVPPHRGEGLGRCLLEATLAKACDLGCSRVFLEVKETNAAAIGLYESFGFELTGRRNGYYRARGRAAIDALMLMWNAPQGRI